MKGHFKKWVLAPKGSGATVLFHKPYTICELPGDGFRLEGRLQTERRTKRCYFGVEVHFPRKGVYEEWGSLLV